MDHNNLTKSHNRTPNSPVVLSLMFLFTSVTLLSSPEFPWDWIIDCVGIDMPLDITCTPLLAVGEFIIDAIALSKAAWVDRLDEPSEIPCTLLVKLCVIGVIACDWCVEVIGFGKFVLVIVAYVAHCLWESPKNKHYCQYSYLYDKTKPEQYVCDCIVIKIWFAYGSDGWNSTWISVSGFEGTTRWLEYFGTSRTGGCYASQEIVRRASTKII